MSGEDLEVQVHFYGVLREITGKSSEAVLLGSPSLEDLLKDLSERYPAPFKAFFFKGERLAPQINVFVNRAVVLPQEIPDRRLHHGDQIDLFAPVSGG